MTEIAYHRDSAPTSSTPFASRLGQEAGQDMKDAMDGMVTSLSEPKPRLYQHDTDADERKERRRGRHGESDGTQSLVMRRSVSGDGLYKSSSRRQLPRWPSGSKTIRRSHTFDGEVVGGHDSKITLSLQTSSSHGSSKRGGEGTERVRRTMSNPNLMDAAEKKSKQKSKKPKSSKRSKSKDRVVEPGCDSYKATISGKGLTGSNSSPSLKAALSSASLKVANTNLRSSSLIDHANLILRQQKTDRLAIVNSNTPSEGAQSAAQPRIVDETNVAGRLFPLSMVENIVGSMKAGKESFPSFLLDDVVDKLKY